MNKRWILALVAALVQYLGLGLVFGIHDLGATLARLPWFWWLLAPAAALVGHGFLFLRWQFYLARLGYPWPGGPAPASMPPAWRSSPPPAAAVKPGAASG
jgi:uncharacterized membrane protein YbhN (UPF0104 family)